MSALPLAPERIPDAAGRPCLGTYQGDIGQVWVNGLAAPYGVSRWMLPFRRKAWVYALVTTPEVILATAVVDLGYAAHAFLTAVDLREKRALVDFSTVGPSGPFAAVNDRPARGMSAHLRTVGAGFTVTRPETEGPLRYQAELASFRTGGAGALKLDLTLAFDGAPPPVSVVSPVPGGGLNVTTKSGSLRTSGILTLGRRRIQLDGGVAGLDATQGLPARATAWRWAMAVGRLEDGRAVTFNLVEGFNEAEGSNESAVWVGKELHPIGRARFGFGRDDPMALWQLETDDGALALRFRPLHIHREERNLGLVRSRFWQLQGFFVGTLRVGSETLQLADLPGVTEDQDVLW